MFSLIAYFPGVPQDDTNALYQYFTSGNYSDWQPPIYTLWWHIFHVRSAEFIINTVVYYSGIIYISYILGRANKKWQNDLLIIFSFYPLYFTQLIISLKDIPYTGFLVLSICALMLLQKTRNVLQTILLWMLFVVSIFLAVGFKYNGIFAVFPMLLYASYFLLCKFSINKVNNKFSKLYLPSISFVMSLVLSSLILVVQNIITFDVFNAKHSYSSMLVMYNDMVNIECSSGDEVVPDRVFVSPDRRGIMCNPFFINYRNYEPLTIANWSGAQNPAILIYDGENTSEDFYNEVKASWIKAVLSHPYDYMKYRGAFLYNIMFNQWWWTPLDTSINNNSIKVNLAKVAVDERHDFATINGMFLLYGTLMAICYVIYARGNKFAIIILMSSLLQLISLYLVLGVPAARFFLWNYLAIILTISMSDRSIKIANIQMKQKKKP